MKTIVAFLCLCVCAVYAGVPLGLHAPAVGYAVHAAPVVHAVAPVAVAHPVAYVDNTHFSYGYLNPYGNGHVSVARTGPIDAHSYTFRAGTWVK